MKKILLTGSNGYISKSILSSFNNTDYDITKLNRSNFDLTDENSLKKWIDDKYFDVVIHTAIEGGNRLKQDDGNTLYRNILMYDNLLDCKNHYKKIHNVWVWC